MSRHANSLLLDTHALVEYSTSSALPKLLRQRLERERMNSKLFVSTISFWELALLVKKGRLELGDVSGWAEQVLLASGIIAIQPTITEMCASAKLPNHHKDPFDRLLIAQSITRDLCLVTRDSEIRQYRVKCLWG